MTELEAIRARHECNRESWETTGVVDKDIARLLAAVDAVRELHVPGFPIFNWKTGLRFEDPCEHCHGKAGVHDCGCWADEDAQYECKECGKADDGARCNAPYPCPTIKALDAALGGAK